MENINDKNISTIKEFLLSNECKIKLNVYEELYSSFQIMDDNGTVYSPNDEGLEVYDEEEDGEDINWVKNEKIYIGSITRDEWAEFPKEDFFEFLDEFLEEEDGEQDLEDFAHWAYDMHGMSFEQSADGLAEQYTAWSLNGEKYLVSQDRMHDQRVYELKIVIES